MAKVIERLGHTPVLPFTDKEKNKWDDLSWMIYMFRSMKLIKKADAICQLDGWESSIGCQIERWTAIRFKKPIYQENDLEGLIDG